MSHDGLERGRVLASAGAVLPLLALFSAAGSPGCDRPAEARRPTEAATQPASNVRTAEIKLSVGPLEVPIQGTLFAAEDVVISTKVAGVLRRTAVDVGQAVAPGGALAEVDQVDYQMAVDQARAALAAALAQLGISAVPDASFDTRQVSAVVKAAAQLENARFTYERLEALGETVSSQELNDALARLRVMEAEYQVAVDAATALLASARERQALLQMAERKLSETRTTAPPIPSTLGQAGAQNWRVAQRLVTEGQYLDVADPLYRLIIDHPLKLRSKVPERYVAAVKPEQTVELEAAERTRHPLGRITRISPVIDPASRTFEIEALVDNAAGLFTPGAFATGFVIAPQSRRSVRLPVEAVTTAGGRARVFVITEGVAHVREVQLGAQAAGEVEIVAGLEEGEQVATRGTAMLTDGAPVPQAP